MASSPVTAEISRLEDASTPAQARAPGYAELLRAITTNSSSGALAEDLNAFLQSLLGESLGIVAVQPLLSSFVETLKGLPHGETQVEIGKRTLELLQPRVASFEEQDANVRFLLADTYEELGEHIEAARVLSRIQLESFRRATSDDDKLRVWIRIVRNYLEVDDTTNAEAYLTRAKSLLYKCQDQELKLMFQLSQARILDARRKFLDACQTYHSLSFSRAIVEEERMRALSSAIVCAVLADAGPPRSRTLSRLYKDERAVQLPEFGILEKIFLDRLLSPDEVKAFAANLAEHHLAQTSYGSTVLEEAVIQHNLLGTSRLYENISIQDLGTLLGTTPEQAGTWAARMVESGRLAARIDQIDQAIYFDGETEMAQGDQSSAGGHTSASDRSRNRNLRKWDTNVQRLTEEVENVTTMLQNRHQDWAAANFVH